MPKRVRAAVAFTPGGPVEIREIEVADPGDGEVAIRFFASGICHSDLHALDGHVPQSFPVVLGHEGIGEVVAVGAGVIDFVPGDRVMPFLVPDCGECAFCRSGRTNLCMTFEVRRRNPTTPFSLDGQPVAAFMGIGSFAELSVVPADMVVKVSEEAEPETACCLACGATTGLGAALITAKVTRGSSVAVFGCGGVGLSVIQGARIAGATQIIGIDSNPTKQDAARTFGATDFVLAGDAADAVAQVQALTGFGADFAFECVGIPALAQQALQCVHPAWGLAVCVGVLPAGAELSTPPFTLMTGRRWTGSFMGGAKRADVARFVDMYVAGEVNLEALVSHRLALDEINRGFEMMKTGESIRSVIVYA